MSSTIKFGTDGWRAIIAEDFTFENVRRVAKSTAAYFENHRPTHSQKRIVIGYDRRFLSAQFASVVAEVIAENGFEVLLADRPTPTPAISYSVPKLSAAGGVMITASHNPPTFNGFKLKLSSGAPADSVVCKEVERLLPATFLKTAATGDRQTIQSVNFMPDYLSTLKGFIDFRAVARSGLRVAHNAMFGVGAGVFDAVLRKTTCSVQTLNGRHDPLFGGINPEPIPANYLSTSRFLNRNPVDICLVTDGDADRLGAMDGRGKPLTTHQIITLLLQHSIDSKKPGSKAVKALTTTSMVDKICAANSLTLVETGVGFKYIAAEFLKGDVMIGFEESGGIGFPDHIPDRDGLLAGLVLLELLAKAKKPIGTLLSQLEKKYGPHRYARKDIHFPLELIPKLMDVLSKNPPGKLNRSAVAKVQSFDGVKLTAANGDWLMLRGSGTEPILRIYAESDSANGVERLIRSGQLLAAQIARAC